jgi:CRISPR-associated protein Cmr5
MMQTRDQQLATEVYNCVEQVKEKYPDEKAPYRKRYGSMAHKLPVLIRTVGLAQALAFVQARGKKDAHKKLLDDLAAVISAQNGETLDASTGETLATTSRTASLHDYMRLTQHVLAALLWFKRFAQSVLKVEPGEEGEDHDD